MRPKIILVLLGLVALVALVALSTAPSASAAPAPAIGMANPSWSPMAAAPAVTPAPAVPDACAPAITCAPPEVCTPAFPAPEACTSAAMAAGLRSPKVGRVGPLRYSEWKALKHEKPVVGEPSVERRKHRRQARMGMLD